MYWNLKLLLRETEIEKGQYWITRRETSVLSFHTCLAEMGGGQDHWELPLSYFQNHPQKGMCTALFFCSVQWPALDGGLWLDSFVPNWANLLVTKFGQDLTPFFSLISLWAATVFWLFDFCVLLFLMGFKFRADLGRRAVITLKLLQERVPLRFPKESCLKVFPLE